MKFEVEIKGISPYLMHKFGLEESQQKTKTGSKDYMAEVNNALYEDEKGIIYVPSTQIIGSLIEAGKQMRIVGKGKSTYSKVFATFAVIEEQNIPMLNQEWEVDSRAVVVPSTKGRVVRYRPKFNEWGLKFNMQINEQEISPEVVKEGLERAGNYSGIGDFRPNKKGPFGRFQVVHFKELK